MSPTRRCSASGLHVWLDRGRRSLRPPIAWCRARGRRLRGERRRATCRPRSKTCSSRSSRKPPLKDGSHAVVTAAQLSLLTAGVTPLVAQTPAESPAPARLSLDEAWPARPRQVTGWRSSRARESAPQRSLDQRKTADLPTIAVQAGYQRTNHVDEFKRPAARPIVSVIYPDMPDNWRTRVDLQWPIYTGGRETRSSGRPTRSGRPAAKTSTPRDPICGSRSSRAYWALVTATRGRTRARESVTRIEAQLRDVRQRFDAGFLPPNDVLSVEAQVSREKSLLIEARESAELHACGAGAADRGAAGRGVRARRRARAAGRGRDGGCDRGGRGARPRRAAGADASSSKPRAHASTPRRGVSSHRSRSSAAMTTPSPNPRSFRAQTNGTRRGIWE